MKAALLKSPGVMELEDLPTPECPPGGALLKIVACAVCGTDVKMLQQGHRDLAYPVSSVRRSWAELRRSIRPAA